MVAIISIRLRCQLQNFRHEDSEDLSKLHCNVYINISHVILCRMPLTWKRDGYQVQSWYIPFQKGYVYRGQNK